MVIRLSDNLSNNNWAPTRPIAPNRCIIWINSTSSEQYLESQWDKTDFYRTRIRSLGMLVTNSLNHSLTDSCLVNLIACEWCCVSCRQLAKAIKLISWFYYISIKLCWCWCWCGATGRMERANICAYWALDMTSRQAGVNKKPKKFKTVWHGFRGILKLSGRVNQASLKLSAGFSNTVCWTS